MPSLNVSATVRDLFAAGTSLLPGKRLLVDVEPVGSSPRHAFLLTDRKAEPSEEYILGIEKYFIDSGWAAGRIRSSVTAFQNPPLAVVEGVSGRCSIQIGSKNYDSCVSLDGRESGLAAAFSSVIATIAAPPMTPWTMNSSFNNTKERVSAVVDLVTRQAAVDTWSVACRPDQFPIPNPHKTFMWSAANPGIIEGNEAFFHTQLADFSRYPFSDEYILVMLPCGWGTVYSSDCVAWMPRLVRRLPWMVGIVAIWPAGVVTRGWDSVIRGFQSYWRKLANPSLSPLGHLLGMESRGRRLADAVTGGPDTNEKPEHEPYLFTGDGDSRAGKPWYAYGWSGSAEAFTAEGVSQLYLSAGFAEDITGVGYLRIKPSVAKTYVTRQQVVALSVPPPDADQKDVDAAMARIADTNASGMHLMCAVSSSKSMDFSAMIESWAPWAEANKDDIPTEDIEVAPGVTVLDSYLKSKSLPDSKDKLVVLGVSSLSLSSVCSSLYVTETVGQTEGSTPVYVYSYVQNGKPVDVDGARTAMACGAECVLTNSTTAMEKRFLVLMTGSEIPWSVWLVGEEAVGIRENMGRHAKRAMEFSYLTDLGLNWIGGQYAADNGSSDRSVNARDLHAIKGSTFGHRMQTISGDIDGLIFEKKLVPVSKRSF